MSMLHSKMFRVLKMPLRSLRRSFSILGIETSCDDTGVAVVSTEGRLLGESLYSQQDTHTEFGGIIPPFARDLHVQNIDSAVQEALANSKLTMDEVDAVAVTVKPGLALSLLVGTDCAKKLCSTYKKPIIPIHHMEAHALTIRMVEKVDFPFLVVLISGGHSLIAVVKDVDEFLLLGKSFDDAPGEAFDKIARRLKLSNLKKYHGMSGGKAIETAAENGDINAFPIGEPLLHKRDCNFSFSGIKNSARSFIIAEEEKHGIIGNELIPNLEDMCASVQYAITKHILRRLQRAIVFSTDQNLINEKSKIVISGGVACNSFVGKVLKYYTNKNGFDCLIPPPKLCTDNGVMIAWNGVEKWNQNRGIVDYKNLDKVDIQARSPLGVDISEEVEKACFKVPRIKLKELERDLSI